MSNYNITEEDKEYDLRVTGAFKIGRSPLCNVTVSDSHVSKVHCSLNIYNQTDHELASSGCSKLKVYITDHSSNGTWIVSESSKVKTRLQKETPTFLKEGDLILLTRSTNMNYDVIAYKYLQSPFPRVMKNIYRPENNLNQETEGLFQCKERDVTICEEIEKPVANVKEDHSGPEAVALNKSVIRINEDEPLTKRTGLSELKKCIETGSLKDEHMNKDSHKGIEIQSHNLEGNNEGRVGNTVTTVKPGHLAQSVSSPKYCKKQDNVQTSPLKRKSESNDDFVWIRKARFKEQIEENFEQHECHFESPVKGGDNCMKNLDSYEEEKSSGKRSSTQFTNSSTSNNGKQKNCSKHEVKPCTAPSVAMDPTNLCNPSSFEGPSELSKFTKVREEHISPRMENVERRSSASGSHGFLDIDDVESGDSCMENLEIHLEDKRLNATSTDVIGKGTCTALRNSREKSFTNDDGIQQMSDEDEVKPCTANSLAMKTTSHSYLLSSESPESGEEKHDSPFANDILYGKCVHCGKQIPQVTISLHEAVCEGFSQEAKSQDHVSLSSLPLESGLPGDHARFCDDGSAGKKEDNGVRNEIECNEGNEQPAKTNGQTDNDNPEGRVIEVSEKKGDETRISFPGNFESKDDLGNCVVSEINDKRADASCRSENIEGKFEESIAGSTEQDKQKNALERGSALIPPDREQPTLRKEESKERSTFLVGNFESKDDLGNCVGSEIKSKRADASCTSENIGENNKESILGSTEQHEQKGYLESGPALISPDGEQPTFEKGEPKERCTSLLGSFESKDDLGHCIGPEINGKRADASCTSGNIERNIDGSTEQHAQKGSLESDPALISPDRDQPTLEKEESKERCTFCSALLPVTELVVHFSTCCKTSAMACTDSEDPESVKEACPYCANYFDVLALVEHVDQCKNLSLIKAVEILREDCSQSSLSDSGSDCVSRSEDDSPMADKELCPKCNGEFTLLELLSHADKCQGKTPKTGSGLESLRADVRNRLNGDIVDDDESRSERGVGDRPDREEKIVERSSERKCDKKNSESFVITGTDNEDINDDASELSREGDDDITCGDNDYCGSRIDDKESVCRDDKDKTEDCNDTDDFAVDDPDFRLDDDESSECNDDEVCSSEDPSGDDEHLRATESSEDDPVLDQFEVCPNCRKLFHLSLLVEHAAKCTTVSLDLGSTMESKTESSKKSTPSESSTSVPIVFSDCSVCGVRLPVHMMGVHYPRCKKRYASMKGSECSSLSPESDPADFPGHVGARIDNLTSRVTVEDRRNESHPGCASGDSPASIMTEVISCTGESDRGSDKLEGISLTRTFSSVGSYHDCEEQCIYCFKMFAVSVLVEHVEACATVDKGAATEDLEQCCYCLQTFPLSELVNHAQNCVQKTISSSQEDSRDGVSSNFQSSSTELLERCMYCFKDFPVSKLIRHAQKCDGDMSGPRERFQGFLPSIHDLSAISSVAILNDTQQAALQYVISRSAQESKKVSTGLLARVQRLGYSEDDLKRTLQWIRSASPIIIHINLDKVLRFLVKDTHYRNQFETGTSGGSTDLRARRSWENRIFNNHYKNSSPSERVKYGVLNIVGDPRGVRSCINYGDSFLQLKKVRLRTTFASMDTSGAGVKLSCCEHYENVMNAYSDPEITAIIDVATGKVPFHRSDCISHYKEVQIHGPVSLSENVECIVVNARHQRDPLIGSLLDLFLEQNKCNLIWMDPDDLTGAAPPLYGAFGHHLIAGSLSGSRIRRRSVGRSVTRKRFKR